MALEGPVRALGGTALAGPEPTPSLPEFLIHDLDTVAAMAGRTRGRLIGVYGIRFADHLHEQAQGALFHFHCVQWKDLPNVFLVDHV